MHKTLTSRNQQEATTMENEETDLDMMLGVIEDTRDWLSDKYDRLLAKI